jgi:hypothetical protein
MAYLKKVYQGSFSAIKRYPAILLPFIIFILFEFLALTVIYLAPRMPLRTVLGPAIRTFYGERFLHYPHNFLLLPTLYGLSKIVLIVVLGSLLTGTAVALVTQAYQNKLPKLAVAFKTALKKYILLFIVVFIICALFYFFTGQFTVLFFKALRRCQFLYTRLIPWRLPITIIINFSYALLIQSAFIYAIPAIMIDNQKSFGAIGKSFIFFKKFFFTTLILIGLPMLMYLPIIILHQNTIYLIDKLFPEFILLVVILGIILNSLIIDSIVTISTTYLYLMRKDILPAKGEKK